MGHKAYVYFYAHKSLQDPKDRRSVTPSSSLIAYSHVLTRVTTIVILNEA